jgi:hypothetical protein
MNGPVVLGIFFILGVCAIFVTMYYYNRKKEGFTSPITPPLNSNLVAEVRSALEDWNTCIDPNYDNPPKFEGNKCIDAVKKVNRILYREGGDLQEVVGSKLSAQFSKAYRVIYGILVGDNQFEKESRVS